MLFDLEHLILLKQTSIVSERKTINSYYHKVCAIQFLCFFLTMFNHRLYIYNICMSYSKRMEKSRFYYFIL